MIFLAVSCETQSWQLRGLDALRKRRDGPRLLVILSDTEGAALDGVEQVVVLKTYGAGKGTLKGT